MPYPSGKHELFITTVISQFGNYFRGNFPCAVFGSNTGLFIGQWWDKIGSLKSVREHFEDVIKTVKNEILP